MDQQSNVESGIVGQQMEGKTIIVTDADGKRAACSAIIKSPLAGAVCFPGEASVSVQGRGAVALSALSAGDRVLVQDSSSHRLAYEPLLGFLHTSSGRSSFLNIQHAAGRLRASANHLVFVVDGTSRSSKLASELRVGDRVLAATETKALASVVLGVHAAESEHGMVAPLTAAGSVVVDNTVASVYATYSASASIPHSAIHAAFFPARLLASVSSSFLVGAWPS